MRLAFFKLALIGFCCRAFVPAGFMPAPLSDGGPIRFCHGGAAGALLTALLEQRLSHDAFSSAHHHHVEHDRLADGEGTHDHGGDHAGQIDRPADHDGDSGHDQDADHDGWDRCPVGTAFALAALTSDFSLHLLPLEHVFEGSSSDLPVPRQHPAPYHARGPPRV